MMHVWLSPYLTLAYFIVCIKQVLSDTSHKPSLLYLYL
jgi:hypothetical protein